jgi:hypothetical protein
VNKRQHYQGLAAECLRHAHETANLACKTLLLEMGQVWGRLAEQAPEAEGSPIAANAQVVPPDHESMMPANGEPLT